MTFVARSPRDLIEVSRFGTGMGHLRSFSQYDILVFRSKCEACNLNFSQTTAFDSNINVWGLYELSEYVKHYSKSQLYDEFARASQLDTREFDPRQKTTFDRNINGSILSNQ